jgi:AcrR family transcriptional regulator
MRLRLPKTTYTDGDVPVCYDVVVSHSPSARDLLLGGLSARADAERNVDALVLATRELVIAGDLNPSAAQIAASAGVGVGTLYRRATRKEALLAAVVVGLLDEIADAAADEATASSWVAFKEFALSYIRIRDVTCSVSHALDGEFDGAVSTATERTRVAFVGLTDRLHVAELLDRSLTAEDLVVILGSIDVPEITLGVSCDVNRRQLVMERIIDSLKR